MTNHERRPHDNAKTTKSEAAIPPPHNQQAEEALLGAALLSKDALAVLATKVVPEDFYVPSNGKIARSLIHAFEQGWPADPVTIADNLKRAGDLDAIGGPNKLLELQVNTPATSNAARYAQIVHDDATLRRIITASQRAGELALTRPFDVHEAVETATGYFSDVAAQNGSRSYSTLDIPNMDDVLSGNIKQQQPTILVRADGQALFYAGKMHVLQAEPSSGKSWIALFSALEVLNMGGAVVYLDYEDQVSSLTGRLLALGGDPAAIKERFQYVRPSGSMGTQEKAELSALLQRLNPDLIILDGVAEAISRDGFDEDRNPDVVKWVNQYPRWLAATGATVVMIDHISKDKEKAGRYARGAGHKLSAVDGASYQVKIIHSFSRHRSGSVKLVVAKDRPGVFTIGEVAAIVKFDPAGGGEVMRMTIEKSKEVAVSDNWKPTKAMERLSLEMERSPNPLQPKLLLDMTTGTGKRSTFTDALARLQTENYVVSFRVGQTQYLRLVKPYREGDQPLPAPATQMTLGDTEIKDELAQRRERKEEDGDPGPIEPTD
jgi:hypothetical protein